MTGTPAETTSGSGLEKRRIIAAALATALAVTVVGTASASTKASAPYRTEKQAERYIHHLRYWHGVHVGSDSFRLALCIGSPLLSNRYNGKGENVYQRFSCSLASNSSDFHMKVWTKRHGGWRTKPGQFSD